MEQELLPLQFRYEPKNRKERRYIKNELNRNVERLFEVEKMFLMEVFNEEDDIEYDTIYDKYLESYNKLTDLMERTNRFVHTVPVENYFYLKYGTEKVLAELSEEAVKINQFIRKRFINLPILRCR